MSSIPYSRYLAYPVTWYSFLIVIGASLALFLSCREEKRALLPRDTVLDLALWLIPGGIIGARIILRFKKQSYRIVFAAASVMVLAGILLEHSFIPLLMTAGGFIAALADDALQVRTNTRLQDMFPSAQRATLISIECFTFSIIMIVLSPLAGWFFSFW